jgi:hypothetical protein
LLPPLVGAAFSVPLCSRFLCAIMRLLSLCHSVMTDDDGDDLNIGEFRFYLIFVSSSGANFFNSFFLF